MALPMLEAMLPSGIARAAGSSPAAPKRMAIITQDLGVLHDTFFPLGASSRNYKMPDVLSQLESIRQEMTVFSRIDHDLKGGHHAAGGVLNGVKPEFASKSSFGAISVDQRAAEVVGSATRYASLRCWGSKSLSSSFSRQGTRLPVSAPAPSEMYKAMFLEGSAAEKHKAKAMLNEGHSILDLVSRDAQRFSKDLGHADTEKLDEYFESIRSVERQFTGRGEWLEKPKPACPDPSLKSIANGKSDGAGMSGTLSAWVDMMHIALATDSSRVASIRIPMNDGVWDLPGVTTGAHTLSHHGMEEWKMKEFRIIQRYILGEYQRLVTKLKADRQADGSSLLDGTLVLYASGLSNGATHSNENLPVLLAGAQGRNGGHLNVERGQSLNSLYLSMLQWFDPAIDGFNGADKPLQGFELA